MFKKNIWLIVVSRTRIITFRYGGSFIFLSEKKEMNVKCCTGCQTLILLLKAFQWKFTRAGSASMAEHFNDLIRVAAFHTLNILQARSLIRATWMLSTVISEKKYFPDVMYLHATWKVVILFTIFIHYCTTAWLYICLKLLSFQLRRIAKNKQRRNISSLGCSLTKWIQYLNCQ